MEVCRRYGPDTRQSQDAVRFGISGLSCMSAALVTNPLEVVKTRMQLDNELGIKHNSKNIFHDRYYRGFAKGFIRIFNEEGVRGLYRGLTPALMREASYSTIRLGLYEPFKVYLGATDPAHTPLWKKICSGAMSGMIGSAIACPTDVIKIRFMALPARQNWEYRNTLHAFQQIILKEGVSGLWTGVGPTVKRAALITATQVSSYDHAKHTILNAELLNEGVILHVTSSVIAGLITTLVTSPMDMVRTRFMNQKKDPGGKPLMYKGTLDCIVKTVKAEGVFGLYKGFIPNWTRSGTHTVVIFFVFEQLRRLVGMQPV